jgi:adenine-specific DNA-methyltransferase
VVDVTLYEGDCLQVMRGMADNSVDAVITDPPYFKVKGEWWDRQWNTAAGFLDWIGQLSEQWQRILKPNGSLYVFASPKMAARVEVQISERFNVLNHIVWRKPFSRHNQADKEAIRGFFPQTERIIFAEHYGADNIAKGEAGYAAKCDELRGFVFEPLRAYLDGERERAGVTREQVNAEWQVWKRSPKGGMSSHWFSSSQWALPTVENYEWLRGVFSRLNHGGAYLQRDWEDLRREYEDLRRPFSVSADVPYTDVWDFPTVAHYPGKHPCEKPAALIRHIITTSTKPGAVVLDCFAGSGVVGEVANKTGRHFIGIEIDKHWCSAARRRIRDAQAQPALVGVGP